MFVRGVAEHAGLQGALDAGLVTIAEIRARVYASSAGDRLLAVGASWSDARTAQQLVTATIGQYTDNVLQVAIRQTSAAETYWQGLRSGYQQAVKDAQAAVQAYVVAYPAPKIGERPTEQTLALQNLNTAITQGQAQVTNAESKIEEARLATQLARSQTGDGLQVVDPPEVPSYPEAVRREQVLAVGVYLFLGLFIVAAMLLVSTLLDRAVRSAEDIDIASGLAVVATVPSIAALSRRIEDQVSEHEHAPVKV